MPSNENTDTAPGKQPKKKPAAEVVAVSPKLETRIRTVDTVQKGPK
jgi:hypothetical protein